MAFQIFWKIKFKSLRAGTDYTVNIYKDGTLPSGYPLTLKGGAQPFVTEEDDSEDMFTPIRTQSGYLRIVDDGWAVNANGEDVRWNWKELLPSTDTDRPVTLTHQSGSSPTVDWQGFMQAQDFGSVLYGNPQEREFPIQCALTVLEGYDINYTQKNIQNFAYLLRQIVNGIPLKCRPSNFVIQGGADAQSWLLKKIDWQNFVSEDSDGKLIARFNLYQCLEDMCRFWGWTARTCGTTMYLTCADDNTETSFLILTDSNLETMAGGTAAGTTSGSFNSVTLSGDIFASTNQDDFIQRGFNKAVVTSDISPFKDEIIKVLPDLISDDWSKNGFLGDDYITHEYTADHTTFENDFMIGGCNSGATFNVERLPATGAKTSEEAFDVIRIKNQYNENNILASLESKYWHCFKLGHFTMKGNILIGGEEITDADPTYTEVGGKNLYMSFGVGISRNSAKWWDGLEWGYTKKKFIARICGSDGVMWSQDIPAQGEDYRMLSKSIPTAPLGNIYNVYGKIFIDIYGTDDLEYNSTDKTLDIADFSVDFARNEQYYTSIRVSRNDQCIYNSTNNNNVRNEFNADCIYGSENYSNFGFGVVLNGFDDYMKEISYNGSSTLERPEQHLADRVTSFWSSSKRRIESELRTNVTISANKTVGDISPQFKLTLDGTTGYPISISHDWRNDITRIKILEL